MSSPRNLDASVREGAQVFLQEITANLHNSMAVQSPRRKGNKDKSPSKTEEHEVKFRFAREFGDVGSVTYSSPESLPSASSYHSLCSTLSTKGSSGICPDSFPKNPNETANYSYVNNSIPGVDDLILACSAIRFNNQEDQAFNASSNSTDLSQDQTFESATDEPTPNITKDSLAEFSVESSLNVTEVTVNDTTALNSTCSTTEHVQDTQERPVLIFDTTSVKDDLSVTPYPPHDNSVSPKIELSKEKSVSSDKSKDIDGFTAYNVSNGLDENLLHDRRTEETSNLNSTNSLSLDKSSSLNNSDIVKAEDKVVTEDAPSKDSSLTPNLSCPTINSIIFATISGENVEELSLPSISTISTLVDESDITFDKISTQDVDNVSVFPRYLSSENSVNVIDASLENILKSPIVWQEENNSNNQPEAYLNLCNTADVKENCTNIPNCTSVITETSEIQKNIKTNITEEFEIQNNDKSDYIVLDKIEAVVQEDNNLVINKSPFCKKPDSWTLDKTESYDFLCGERQEILEETDFTNKKYERDIEEKEIDESLSDELNSTLVLEDVCLNLKTVQEVEQYTEFKPQRQSTTLALINEQPDFDEFRIAAEKVVSDIYKSSLESTEDSDRFTSATSEIFQDPTSFDFLLARSHSKTINRLRTESLYVKFDPLVSDTSMLPEENSEPINEEQNGKNENALPNAVGTPKRNPAIAAIDRLLFYSPISTGTTTKSEETQKKIERPVELPETDARIIADINMSKELELVRATVLQLEEELEKQKKEYAEEIKKEKNAFQDKINKLEAQIAQEIRSTSQMTVVVDEYEKSISRLLTERERDRTNFETEKAKLQEELQATNVHLTNTEAAFNDVHQKYEKLKGAVSVYKHNETVLAESIQANLKTIKGLEMRYDHLKNHAAAQLEKANFELEAKQKQSEDETIKLHAMLRKAELKSNSLAELVEQKTKENKELTQILDEVIARVGHQNAE